MAVLTVLKLFDFSRLYTNEILVTCISENETVKKKNMHDFAENLVIPNVHNAVIVKLKRINLPTSLEKKIVHYSSMLPIVRIADF